MTDIFRIRPSRRSARQLAQHGVVRGGKFNGYTYAFERFSFTPRQALRVHVLLGEPGWPFPRPAELKLGDFASLRPVKGSRAKRLDAEALINEALTNARAAAPHEFAREGPQP